MDLSSALIDAIARYRAGDRAAVRALCEAVLALAPDQATALRLMGLSTDVPAEARMWLTRACAVTPGDQASTLALAQAQLRDGDPAAALARAWPVTERRPGLAAAWFVAGSALSALNRAPEAIRALTRAQALDPDHAETATNLGNAHLDVDDLDAAEVWLRRAVALDPDQAEAWASLGFLFGATGRTAAAVAACDTALRVQPDLRAAHWNRATALLLAGEWARAWPDFQWRWNGWQPDEMPAGPRWDGGPTPDGRLLVLAEQGLGDAIHLSRYLPELAERFDVTLVCRRSQHSLFAELPARLLPPDAELPDSAWINMMALPGLLGATPARVPGAAGWLATQRLPPFRPPGAGPRVGLVWRGSPDHTNDRRRSMPTADLRPLLDIAGVEFVSLQVGPLAHEATSVLGLPDLGAGLRDWGGTRDLLATCDLVISADTSTAHLAGAMGVPTWIMLPFMPDWRWGFGERTPWYDSVRLFRQPQPGDWGAVVAGVAGALQAMLQTNLQGDIESARKRATLRWCSSSVLANACPPVPSATKYSASVAAGRAAAASAASPGLAIGPAGSPATA